MRRSSVTLALLSLACSTPARADEPPGPRFVDVALERGLEAGSAHRNVWADLDGDGWNDAIVDNERVYRNVADPRGGRRFVRSPGSLASPRPDLLLFADLDDDGDQDALVSWRLDPTKAGWEDPGRRSHIRLYEYDANGDITGFKEAFALPPEPLPCAAFLDYDLDGRLDLVTGGDYTAGGLPLEAHPLRLYRGLGDGRFEEVTDAAGLTLRREPGHLDSRRSIFGLSTADLDGDGWPDIVACAYGRQRNLLFRNQGDGRFVDVGVASGVAGDEDTSGVYPPDTKRFFKERYGEERQDEQPFRSNGNTFDAPAGDVDNDGDLDLFLAEITHAWAGSSSDRSALLENLVDLRVTPDGTPTLRFLRRPDAMPRTHAVPNWNQGDLYAGWTDADLDGRLDLVLASGDYPDDQRLRLFRQSSRALRFDDVTAAAGIDLDNSAMLSLADYDRDGDQDILTGNTNMRSSPEVIAARVLKPFLLENQAAGGGARWLSLRLVGRGAASGGSNRDAIGARAIVFVGRQQVLREVQGGLGHCGHRDGRELCFGLGAARQPAHVVVRWPTRGGVVTVLEGLALDRTYEVREPAPGEPAQVVDLGPH